MTKGNGKARGGGVEHFPEIEVWGLKVNRKKGTIDL